MQSLRVSLVHLVCLSSLFGLVMRSQRGLASCCAAADRGIWSPGSCPADLPVNGLHAGWTCTRAWRIGQRAQADAGRPPLAQTGVFHYGFPGVIKLAEGAFEAVVVYVYIKGLRHKDTVTFRGFMFAQVRAWAHKCLLACRVRYHEP